MNSALYYPHSTIHDEALLKQAILLWDRIDVIAPNKDFKLVGTSPDATDALDLFANSRAPTHEEKKAAHQRIIALASNPLPEWFAFDLSKEQLRYLIYPQKFLSETWDVLKQSNLAKQSESPGDFEDYVLCRWFGLTMMSVLAEECAGSELRLLTDEQDSYSALGRYLTAEYHGTYSKATDFDGKRLVTTTMMSIDLNDVSLKDLVNLRRREDSFLRGLRLNYLKEVDSAAKHLSTAKTESDRNEIESEFGKAMNADFMELAKALRRESIGTLLSKEMLVTYLAAAGAVIEPWTSSVVGVGALIKAASSYRAKREEIMKKHATSWLYQTHGSFQLY